MKTFSEFALPPVLVQALDAMEFKTPSPIQAQAIGPALEGKDILAIAPTGTGKTGAFGIPNLSFLYPQPGKQVLILAPTRELAAQIFKFLRELGKSLDVSGVLIVGGESYSRQRSEVKRGVDYIVATPGRLMDHIGQGMPTERIGVLVLDEVDRMLDMGFAPQVEEIVNRLGPERQTFLFSATMPPEILKLANKYLKDPIRVKVEGSAEQKPLIDEENIDTTDTEKPALLIEQVTARTGKILVFANTQGRVEQVARRLHGAGHPTACIHGARTHRERKLALEAFRSGECRVLVATDIVARGIDVADVEHVINYDYPATKEDYLHRIGRTGRMGKKGNSVTFVDPKRKHMSRRRPPGQRSGGGGFSTGPRFKAGGERPRFDRKSEDRPRFERSATERPKFDRGGAERPKFDRAGAERPKFDRKPEDRPRFERSATERPRFDRGGAERPRFDRASAERPRFGRAGDDRPRQSRVGSERPRFDRDNSERPKFGRPRDDRFKPGGFGSEKPSFGKKPRFASGGDRPPHPGIFRQGEVKPHTPAAGPRHFSKRPMGPKKELYSKAKPAWVRGKAGTVRRNKGKQSQPSNPGFDNHGLEFPA